MGQLIVITNLSLDGVMQAPGRADEDTRDGFSHGGWAAKYAAMHHAGAAFANVGALLFGRRTYEDFHAVWPSRPESPYTEFLNTIPKYVVSGRLTEPLPWKNSQLLSGTVGEAVAQLKAATPSDILVFGSGELVKELSRQQLIDKYVLLFHPLLLGTGRRLFAEAGVAASLHLTDVKPTESGVVIATYEAAKTEAVRVAA